MQEIISNYGDEFTFELSVGMSPLGYDEVRVVKTVRGLAMRDLALELKGVTYYLSSELKP